MTVYRALKYSETNPGDWVVLPGAGGGLGHLGASLLSSVSEWSINEPSAIQYAKYMGRRVIAIGTLASFRLDCEKVPDLGV